MPLELACSHRQSQSACTVRANRLAPNQLKGDPYGSPFLMPCLKPPKRGRQMRAIRQERQMLGNPHWTGTAQATSPLDKDAADQEVRGFRIPNGTGGLFAGRGRSTSHHRSSGSGIPHPSGEGTSPPKGKDRQRMARSAHDGWFEGSMH